MCVVTPDTIPTSRTADIFSSRQRRLRAASGAQYGEVGNKRHLSALQGTQESLRRFTEYKLQEEAGVTEIQAVLNTKYKKFMFAFSNT